VFEKYSENTHRIIRVSRLEAGAAGASAIDPAHLLLAILREDETRFKRLTRDPNLSKLIRTRLERPHSDRNRIPESVELPIADEYKDVLLRAATEANHSGSVRIEPQHLLLAILRMKDCPAANVLVGVGISYDTLKEAVAKERGHSE
jgi:ATP-dependent Clp protease ATP-binding subunit ClpC